MNTYTRRVTVKEKMSGGQLSAWCLIDRAGRRLRLPRTMIFLGREDCDISIQSRSVDKRHAVLSFDEEANNFRVKDLGSLNGTFVNDNRIPEQEYVTLGNMDTVRLGYDPMVYRMERIDEIPHLEMESLLTPSTELPAWATREAPAHKHCHSLTIAECQGCIAEQGIQHTCGSYEDDVDYTPRAHGVTSAHENGVTTLPPRTPVNRWAADTPTCAHSGHSYGISLVNGTPASGHVTTATHSHSHLHQSHSHHKLSSHSSPEHQPARVPKSKSFPDGSSNLGSSPQHFHTYQPHIKPGISTHAGDVHPSSINPSKYRIVNVQFDQVDGNSNVDAYSKHYNSTAAKVPMSQEDYPVPMDMSPSPMGYVSMPRPPHTPLVVAPDVFPDSIYSQDTSNTSAGQTTNPDSPSKAAAAAAPSISPGSPLAARQDKRRSLTGQESDLETVRKCTPLYGQPSWWGEGEAAAGAAAAAAAAEEPDITTMQGADKVNNNSNIERPNSLSLDASGGGADIKYKSDPRYGITYMEIPQRDTSPEKDAAPKPTSSTPPEKDTNPSTDGAAKSGSPEAASIPATAFTIDFGEDAKASKVSINEGLSKFLPKKLRKNFKARSMSVKAAKEATEASEEANKEQNEESAVDRANRTWAGSSDWSKRSPAMTKRNCGYHSDGHHSNLSSDNEDLSISSDVGANQSGKKPPSSGRRGSGTSITREKTYTVMKHKRNSKEARSSPMLKSSTEMVNTDRNPVRPSTKSPNFLIDKMFTAAPGGDAGGRDDDPYRESREYKMDKVKVPKSSSGKPTTAIIHPQRSTQEPQRSLRPPMEEHPDNVSESGTYTIESDTKEMDEARQSIDAVFGVTCDMEMHEMPIIGSGYQAKDDAGQLTDEDGEELPLDERTGHHSDGDSTPTEFDDSPPIDSKSPRWASDKFSPITDSPNTARRKKYKEGQVEREETDSAVRAANVGASSQVDRPSQVKPKKGVFEEQRSGAWADEETPESERAPSPTSVTTPRKPRPGSGRILPTPPVKSLSAPGDYSNGEELTPAQLLNRASATFVKERQQSASPEEKWHIEHVSPTKYSNGGRTSGTFVKEQVRVSPGRESPEERWHIEHVSPSKSRNTSATFIKERRSPPSPEEQWHVQHTSPAKSRSNVVDRGSPSNRVISEELDEKTSTSVSNITKDEMSRHREQRSYEVSRHREQRMVETTRHGLRTEELMRHDQYSEELSRQYKQHSLSPETSRTAMSIDTDVLLKDTEDVVRCFAERVSKKNRGDKESSGWRRDPQPPDDSENHEPPWKRDTSPWRKENSGSSRSSMGSSSGRWRRSRSTVDDSDSDASSSHAVINGHPESEAQHRPKVNKSKSVEVRKPPKPTKTQLLRERRSMSRERQHPHTQPQPMMGTRTLQRQNVSSEFDTTLDLPSDHSECNSIVSSSTEYSESHSPKLSRKTKSKSPSVSAKPNRAFALRQARAQSVDLGQSSPRSDQTKPQSRPNSASSQRSDTSARARALSVPRDPSSPRSTTPRSNRTRAGSVNQDSSRSKASVASLGGQIVKRSRENPPLRTKSANSQPIARTDSGLGNLRKAKSRTPDPKPSSALTVAGSKPQESKSRTSSPRSDEYSAWKRRKGYDPRRAVQEAKDRKKSSSRGSQSGNGEFLRESTDNHSACSSEADLYQHEDVFGNEAGDGDAKDELSRFSQEVLREVSVMSRNIENESFCYAAPSTTNHTATSPAPSSFRSISNSHSSRSAFSVCSPKPSLNPPVPSPTYLASIRGSSSLRALTTASPKSSNTSDWMRSESYDNIMVTSIYHVSNKVKGQTDRLLEKLRAKYQLSATPSPIDDIMGSPSEAGNQELIGILRNLRHSEHHLQLVERVLFPIEESSGSRRGSQSNQQYMQELQRIRGEMAGFRPIEQQKKTSQKTTSKTLRTATSYTTSRKSSNSSHGSDAFSGDDYY